MAAAIIALGVIFVACVLFLLIDPWGGGANDKRRNQQEAAAMNELGNAEPITPRGSDQE